MLHLAIYIAIKMLMVTHLPPIIYSGSIERVDFGERKEEKGFVDVTIHAKEETTYEFVKTPTRPFIQIEVHLFDTTRSNRTNSS